MEVKVLKVGYLETNCYILTYKNKCLIIDPGAEFGKIKKAIGDNEVVGCLVTHFHQDHIEALEELISYYDIPINKDNFDPFQYKIIETPGHTFDSKSFYFLKEEMMFTGDFIFKDGIGRTDLGGNNMDMIDSLKNIEKYPDNIKIYPGHGLSTILGSEKIRFDSYYK